MVTNANIIFRTDASLAIGSGHVMRCLTLARKLRSVGKVCRFVTRAHQGHLGKWILKEGFEVDLLPTPQGPPPGGPPTHAHWAGVDWVEDAAQTGAILEAWPPSWLIVDHYALDTRWLNALRSKAVKVMVIDDLADRPLDCDLLLDQNFGHSAKDYAGLLSNSCSLLIGPKFALLRPEFATMRANSIAGRTGRGLRKLLITMGGVDLVDATSVVLSALQDATLGDDIEIKVILGSSAPALNKVLTLARNISCSTLVAVDVTDMSKAMAEADLAISAGGGTTWERCCLGLPSIIVETAKNQAGIASEMAAQGAALDPGPLDSKNFSKTLVEMVIKINDPKKLDAMSANASTICDGEGANRVLRRLQELT